jgi:hypothetical protein
MCFILLAILSFSVGLVVSIVPVLCIGWGGLGGYEISGVSSHSPLECGFGYSGLLNGGYIFMLRLLAWLNSDEVIILNIELLLSLKSYWYWN